MRGRQPRSSAATSMSSFVSTRTTTGGARGAFAPVSKKTPPPRFAPALDVPKGGVLCALPALLAVGLLEGEKRDLTLPKGYCGLDSLLMLLAFMALARLKSIEPLRYCAPWRAKRGVGASFWGWIGPRKCAPCGRRFSCWPKGSARAMERDPVRALDGCGPRTDRRAHRRYPRPPAPWCPRPRARRRELPNASARAKRAKSPVAKEDKNT